MLFGDQREPFHVRLARTVNRLRREGIPEPAIQTQLKIIAAGFGLSGAGVSEVIQAAIRYAGSLSNSPPENKRREAPAFDPMTHERKRLRRGYVNEKGEFTEETEMEEAPEVNAKALSANASSSNSSNGGHTAKESKILNIPHHYGLPEADDVMIPFTFYFSGSPAGTTAGDALDFRIRMTSLADVFVDSVTTSPTAGGVTSETLYTHMITHTAPNTWPDPAISFPSTMTAGGGFNTERGTWRDFFAKQYDYYVIKQCEWEITMQNQYAGSNADLIVAIAEEAYGSSSSGNVVPDDSQLAVAESYPGLRWGLVKSNTTAAPRQNIHTFQGTYYPGSANKNVRNDEDTKTWTPTTSTPTLTEQLHVMVWRAPFNQSIGSCQGFNCRVHLRMRVQFRDLKQPLRYPDGTGLVLNATDILALPSGL